MFCSYAGCDCIVPDQVENGCKDCELKLDRNGGASRPMNLSNAPQPPLALAMGSVNCH